MPAVTCQQQQWRGFPPILSLPPAPYRRRCQGRNTKMAGMPLTKSGAELTHLNLEENGNGNGAKHTRFHPAQHPSGLPAHPVRTSPGASGRTSPGP